MSSEQPLRSQRNDGQFVTKIVHPKHPREYVEEAATHLLSDWEKEQRDPHLGDLIYDWAWNISGEIHNDAASIEHAIDVYAILTDEYDVSNWAWMGDTAVRESICYPQGDDDWRDSIVNGIGYDLCILCIREELSRRLDDEDEALDDV